MDAATEVIDTIAGTGVSGDSGDGGSATGAEVRFPSGLGFEADGDLYITTSNRIRRVAPFAAAAAVAALEELVMGADLEAGIEASLTAKLDAAAAALARGDEGAAINQLGAFINAVEAQTGKAITEPAADTLSQEAGFIISQLEG